MKTTAGKTDPRSGSTGATLLGRPRSDEANDAMLDAALATLAEEGIAGVTVQKVCARSGCSRATFYRRWPTVWDCMVEATDRELQPIVWLESCDSLREAVVSLGLSLYRAFTDHALRAFYGIWFMEGEARPQLIEKLKTRHQGRRETLRTWLDDRLAQEGRSLLIPTDVLIDLMNGLALNAVLLDRPLARQEVEVLLDVVLGCDPDGGFAPFERSGCGEVREDGANLPAPHRAP